MSVVDRAIDELVARHLPHDAASWTREELTECLLEMVDESDELSDGPACANVVLMDSMGVELLFRRIADYDGWHGES